MGRTSTGLDLIAAKVKELRIMAGCFDYTVAPDGENEAEYNCAGDPSATTCEGGSVAVDTDGACVVTPGEGVSAVEIGGLSNGVEVVGVKIGASVVPAAAFVGFGERNTAGVFSLALDPNGVVTIDGKEIPVKPTIGDLDEGEEVEPFTVGEGSAAVTVRAIPGLKYELMRGESVEAVCGGETPPPQRVVCESVVAEATMVIRRFVGSGIRLYVG